MSVGIDEVRFGAGGQVVPVEGKRPVLFSRELRTYQDLPKPLAAAVGKVLAIDCGITMGYRHGPTDPILAAGISRFGMDSQDTCLRLGERWPRTVSETLALFLIYNLGNGGAGLSVLNQLLAAENPPEGPDFRTFQKEAVQGALDAMRGTMAILRSMNEGPIAETQTRSMGDLLSRRPINWTCSGDGGLTISGNIPRLMFLPHLLKGCLGKSDAVIHWVEDSDTLGVAAVKLEVTGQGRGLRVSAGEGKLTSSAASLLAVPASDLGPI